MDSIHRLQDHWKFIGVAISASLATLAAVSAYESYRRTQKRKQLMKDIQPSLKKRSRQIPTKEFMFPESNLDETESIPMSISLSMSMSGPSEPSTPPHLSSNLNNYSEDLIREQLARNYAFFGEDSMRRIRDSFVVVVGCGGVGSYAALMLARSGVSKIRLVDFDYVTLSSLNRHATAVLSDVGTPKVVCVGRVIRETAKWVDVEARIEIWRKDAEDTRKLLKGADWVIDAIDNISTKVDLLKYCHDHKIKVFSAMGAGAKCDPTRVQISDISYTVYDPLARSVRRRLRLQGVTSGIPVVYSTETPSDVKLLPLPEEEFKKGNVSELNAFDDFRVRILPVIGPLPAIFGLNIATYILADLAGKPILNPLPVKNRYKTYERLMRDLTANEAKLAGKNGLQTKLPLDEDDIWMIYEDLHRGGRSIIPPHDVPARSTLTRWDLREPLSLTNCVVMEFKDAEMHWKRFQEGTVDPAVVWGSEVAQIVNSRIEEVRKWREWVM